MTKEEIINETIDWYTYNPRSINTFVTGSGCYYFHPYNSCTCAIGRCMNTSNIVVKNLISDKGHPFNTLDIDKLLQRWNLGDIDYLLKKNYKGHPLLFWKNIQRLHDTKKYWYGAGLSNEGMSYIEFLKKKYAKS